MELSWTAILGVFSIAALESLLSIDNAVVLALIARELKPHEQRKALRYGLLGAIILRLIAVSIATHLIRYQWIKILGGIYLGYLVINHFVGKRKRAHAQMKAVPSFWKTVAMIEFTDLAFAIDSILAAVALTDQYWVIVIGGLIGVMAIRFAAQGMIKILERFPKIETFAYLLVAAVAIKVIYEGSHSFL